jgi:hypothetical protein
MVESACPLPPAIETIIPHSQFGSPSCSGCLAGIEDEGMAEILCKECGAVIAYVSSGDLKEILNGMANAS